jgi:D-sedoheptulose 7-phosphate isomerase
VAEFQIVVAATKFTDGRGQPVSTETGIQQVLEMLRDLRHRKGRLYLVGNGGSAAVASHSVTDFMNVADIRATTLHDPSLFSCMANDYGYEAAFARILSTVASKGDMLISISSSGKSKNILNAASKMREVGGTVITLSGFDQDNPLRQLGDMNVWLDSHDYGFVEIGHQFVLHNMADRLRIEKSA